MHYFMYKIYVRRDYHRIARGPGSKSGATPVPPCGEIKIFGRSDIFLYSANKYLNEYYIRRTRIRMNYYYLITLVCPSYTISD